MSPSACRRRCDDRRGCHDRRGGGARRLRLVVAARVALLACPEQPVGQEVPHPGPVGLAQRVPRVVLRLAHGIGELEAVLLRDGEHRGDYQLAGLSQNTWAAGVDRILVGAAVDGVDVDHLGTTLALDDLDSADLELAGSLAELIEWNRQHASEEMPWFGQEILERTQRGQLDVTPFIAWFVDCVERAVRRSEATLERVFANARFWETHQLVAFDERQRKVLLRLLDGFEGKLTTSKWAKLTKTSQDTALRDIHALLAFGVLIKNEAGGRSTSYALAELT